MAHNQGQMQNPMSASTFTLRAGVLPSRVPLPEETDAHAEVVPKVASQNNNNDRRTVRLHGPPHTTMVPTSRRRSP